MTFRDNARPPPKVLIAEDSATQAELIRALLEDHALDVRIARNGREALMMARTDRPHLLISDIVMPEMDGYALCRAIKSDPDLKDTPVILVTNLVSPTNILEGINSGADNFITKPYDEDYLLARIDYLLANRILRGSSKLSSGLRIEIDGKTHLITAEREQMLDVLMSVYAEAARFSEEVKASEISLREANRTLDLLHRSVAALNTAVNESEVITAALTSCGKLSFVKAVWLVLVDDVGTIRKFESTGSQQKAVSASAGCLCVSALVAGNLTDVTLVDACELVTRSTPAFGGKHAAVPLISSGQRLGVLSIAGSEWDEFSERELEVVATLGGQISAALERVQNHERLERTVIERTAQLRAEIAERERTDVLMHDALESVAGGIAIFDADERLVMCNAIYRNLYPEVAELIVPGVQFENLARAGLANGQYTDVNSPEEWLAATLQSFRERKGAFEQHLKTGQWVSVTYRPMSNGWTAGLRINVTDAREARKREMTLQEQLSHAQKMEAIGNLTGGMAHDFNNILGIIVGNLEIARELLQDDAVLKEMLDEAFDAAWRGADLTRRLLAFARKQPLRPERLDISKLVTEVAKMLRRLLGENIEIELGLSHTAVWPVVVDPAQLEASLINLAVNARDAMPDGGRLLISTGNRHLDADYAAMHDMHPGNYAMIEICDNGTGISPEVQSRIFEPFFTTKEAGKGTGLGLSMVFGFIKQSDGHVAVYSEVGAGTAFRLYLPRADLLQSEERTVNSTVNTVARSSGETVLVVEDNLVLRRVVMRQLTELGYRVLESEATAALGVLDREPVDLLMTDIVMPGGLDGIVLAQLALERYSSLKVLLTSGFPRSKFDSTKGLFNTLQLLSKPYGRNELAVALRNALGS